MKLKLPSKYFFLLIIQLFIGVLLHAQTPQTLKQPEKTDTDAKLHPALVPAFFDSTGNRENNSLAKKNAANAQTGRLPNIVLIDKKQSVKDSAVRRFPPNN